MHHPATPQAPSTSWLRWSLALALAVTAAIAAIQLARVDADLGAVRGPERTIRALDATPGVAPGDAAQARAILEVRPVDGAAYRVLAQVEDAAGNPERAAALYQTAVDRWPRDRIARGQLADRAFAANDLEAGLTHLDALLRVAPELRAPVLAALVPYLADPRMREGLVARLARSPPWRDAVPGALLAAITPTTTTATVATAAPAATNTNTTNADATNAAAAPAAAATNAANANAAPAEALLAALATQSPPTPAELQTRLTLLQRLNRPAQARALWIASLAPDDRAAAGLVFDGGFEGPDTSDGYGWQLSAPAGAAIGHDTVGAPEGESMLAVRFDGRAVQFAGVRQSLALPPGRYRLQLAVRNQVDTVRPFLWRIACTSGPAAPLAELMVPTAGTGQWQTIAAEFEVPIACTAQSLQLLHSARSLSEQRLRGELLFDAVLISRVH